MAESAELVYCMFIGTFMGINVDALQNMLRDTKEWGPDTQTEGVYDSVAHAIDKRFETVISVMERKSSCDSDGRVKNSFIQSRDAWHGDDVDRAIELLQNISNAAALMSMHRPATSTPAYKLYTDKHD